HLQSETRSDTPALHSLMRQFPVFTRLHHFMAQADSQRSVGELVTGSLFIGIVGGWASDIWLPTRELAALAGMALAALPFVYFYVLRARRFKQFEELLPDAIALISRALRAGHAISSAIELVSNE